MKKIDNELLQRYYDGELSSRKTKTTAAKIEGSQEARASLEKNQRITDLVCLMNDELLDSVSFEGFKKQVMSGVVNDYQPGVFERFKIWASEFFEYKQVIWVPSAVAVGLAVIVALALPLLSTPQSPSNTLQTGQENGIWLASTNTPTETYGSTIETVNFGESSGEKYQIEIKQGSSVGVVWITE
jgi:hypothetical protein